MNAGERSKRGTVVLVVAAAVAIGSGALTSRLSVKSDLSYLLPESTPSVRQLRALEKRARITATFMLGVESTDVAARARARATAPSMRGAGSAGVAARARAGEALLRRIRALDAPALGIGGVTSDDG